MILFIFHEFLQACKVHSSLTGIGVEYDFDIYSKAVNNVEANHLTSQVFLVKYVEYTDLS